MAQILEPFFPLAQTDQESALSERGKQHSQWHPIVPGQETKPRLLFGHLVPRKDISKIAFQQRRCRDVWKNSHSKGTTAFDTDLSLLKLKLRRDKTEVDAPEAPPEVTQE